MFTPDKNHADRIVATINMGRQIGTKKGQDSLKVVLNQDGKIITAYPAANK